MVAFVLVFVNFVFSALGALFFGTYFKHKEKQNTAGQRGAIYAFTFCSACVLLSSIALASL